MAERVDPITNLITELSRLPGIGEKTASRLAFHILTARPEWARSLAKAIEDVVDRVGMCSVCCNLAETDPCPFCRDPRRDDSVICVVEGVPDLVAVDRTGEFRGRFHVLHGALSPLDGIGPEMLRIRELLRRLEGGQVREVIVATNPSVEGEATALYLTKLIKPAGIEISRIALGIPVGGDLEYADQATLARAIAGRRPL